jgi:hypothetical protein
MAQPMTASCPHCGQKFKIKSHDFVERQARCPGCAKTFTIELSTSEQEYDVEVLETSESDEESKSEPKSKPEGAESRKTSQANDEADTINTRKKRKKKEKARKEPEKKYHWFWGPWPRWVAAIVAVAFFLILVIVFETLSSRWEDKEVNTSQVAGLYVNPQNENQRILLGDGGEFTYTDKPGALERNFGSASLAKGAHLSLDLGTIEHLVSGSFTIKGNEITVRYAEQKPQFDAAKLTLKGDQLEAPGFGSFQKRPDLLAKLQQARENPGSDANLQTMIYPTLTDAVIDWTDAPRFAAKEPIYQLERTVAIPGAASFALSPDGSTAAVVICQPRKQIQLIDTTSGKTNRTFDVEHGGPRLFYTADGTSLVIGNTPTEPNAQHSVGVYSVATGTRSKAINFGPTRFTTNDAADSYLLDLDAGTSKKLSVSLPTVVAGEWFRYCYRVDPVTTKSLLIGADDVWGAQLVQMKLRYDQTTRRWSDDLLVIGPPEHSHGVSVRPNPNAARFVAQATGENAAIWDTASGKGWHIRHPVTDISDAWNQIAWHPTSEMAAFGVRDIYLWELSKSVAKPKSDATAPETPEPAYNECLILKGHQTRVVALSFTPDGKTLISLDQDGKMKFWRIAEAQLQKPPAAATPGQILRQFIDSETRLKAYERTRNTLDAKLTEEEALRRSDELAREGVTLRVERRLVEESLARLVAPAMKSSGPFKFQRVDPVYSPSPFGGVVFNGAGVEGWIRFGTVSWHAPRASGLHETCVVFVRDTQQKPNTEPEQLGKLADKYRYWKHKQWICVESGNIMVQWLDTLEPKEIPKFIDLDQLSSVRFDDE